MSEFTVQRVFRDFKGSVISETLSISATEVDVENIVDFDAEGGDYVLGADSGTYTGIVEAEGEDTTAGTVVGLDPAVTIAHPKGTFLYEGDHPRGPKRADGYLDGDDSLLQRVLIPAHLRRYFPSGKRTRENMEVVEIAYDDDGVPYITDADFDEESAVEPVVFTWSATGNVSVGTKVHRFPVPFGGTIEEVKMVMGTGGAPTGDDIIVDILKGGVSILTTKVVIADGDLGSDPVEPTTKEVNKGNILQIEFEQVGSTTPGSNPTLYVTMFPSENAIARRIEVEGPTGPSGADGSDGLISELQSEGTPITDAGEFNVTGAGATFTSDGTTATLDVPGGGGGAFVGCRVYLNSATQAIANNTNVAVAFDGENIDSDGFHDNATNNSRITIPTGMGGIYSLEAHVQWDINATGVRQAFWRLNGTTPISFAAGPPTNGAATVTASFTLWELAADDYVEFLIKQTSGGSLNAVGGSVFATAGFVKREAAS